jgi:TRAP-type C4-dicarboxylate transport system substrate-binding protein
MMRSLALSLPAMMIAGALCAQTLAPGPRVAITAVTQPGPTLPQYTMVDVPLLRDGFAARSNGRVAVTLQSWPERGVGGPEVIRLVRSGQVEIAGATLGVVSGDVPMLDALDLAGLNPTLEQARRVADAMMPVLNADLERVGVRMLAVYPFPAQVFFCRRPVTGLASMRGLRVRTNGPSVADFVQAYGAQAAAIAFPEVYSALERGTVDCAITGTGTGNGVKWWEVTTHMYTLPSTWSLSGYFVNLAWWNRQTPEVRAFLEDGFRQVADAQWTLGAVATQDGIDCNLGLADRCRIHTVVPEARRMIEVVPTAADLATIRTTLTETVLPAWVRRCGARCAQVYNDVIAPISGVRAQ